MSARTKNRRQAETSGGKLAQAWTFFLGCVFLIAGLTHSVVPWAVETAPQLGLGLEAPSMALRSLAVHIQSVPVIVGLAGASTVIHAMGGLLAIVGKFRQHARS